MGEKAFHRSLSFDEFKTLECNLDYIRRDLASFKITRVDILIKEEMEIGKNNVDEEDVKKAEGATPGQPLYRMV